MYSSNEWIISLANNQFALHHQPQLIDANLFRKQALQAKLEAEKEGIVVPLTLEEYCLKPKPNPNNQEPQVSMISWTRLLNNEILFQLDMTDFYDDAYDCSESDSESMNDGEDSGNAE